MIVKLICLTIIPVLVNSKAATTRQGQIPKPADMLTAAYPV
jgi:hypothetical protein